MGSEKKKNTSNLLLAVLFGWGPDAAVHDASACVMEVQSKIIKFGYQSPALLMRRYSGIMIESRV
jgi:hypothetical protein